MAAPSRDLGLGKMSKTGYTQEGNPVGDIWTSKTVAKAVASQLRESNTASREWVKAVAATHKDFEAAFNNAVRVFCKQVEDLARLQDEFQKDLSKKTVDLEKKLSKANADLRAGKKGAQKKKDTATQLCEKLLPPLEAKYAIPLWEMGVEIQRKRSYFSEIVLKYWEMIDKTSTEAYNDFVDLDVQLGHEAINIDFSALSMLHDKCVAEGARLQPLQFVIIPKEIRTLPKIKYTPKRELTRLNTIKISTAPESSSSPSASPMHPTSSSSTSSSVSTPAVSTARAGASKETEQLLAEVEKLRAENEALKEENEKMARQVRLVKLTLQNEVQDNTRLREKLRELGHQDEDSDDSD